MVVEKRKSQNNAGAVNTPPKKGNFGNQRSPFQKSPGGGNQKPKFGGGGGGGGAGTVKPGDWPCPKPGCGVNNFASRQECFKCRTKKPGDGGSPRHEVPPPPAQGAKKLKIEVVPPKAEVKPNLQTAPKKNAANNAKNNQKPNKKQEKNGLNKISDASKTIKKPKKSRSKKFNQKLDLKPRPREACELALKTEKELGHTGKVYSIKVADPPLSQEVVKSWSSAIETAVFSKPVEPRQFLVVFKHNANVKKEIETLKKVVFAGGKIQVEEKSDADANVKAHPEAVDPYSLYVTNLHESVTKEKLKELFPKATLITNAKKHSPKLGNPSKFAFINFETTDDALSSFKENYSAVLNGNSIVMRFRRVSPTELAKMNATNNAVVANAKKIEAKPKQTPKAAAPTLKKEPLKVEPESDDEEDLEDEEDDDEEAVGGALEMGGDDDEDDDDDDDLEGEEEEDDDDEDDDEEEDEEDDDDDDDDDDDE